MGLAGLGAITRSKREQPFFLRLWRKESWATGGGRRRRRMQRRGVGQKEGLVLEEEGRRRGSSMLLPNYPTVSNEKKTDLTGAH